MEAPDGSSKSRAQAYRADPEAVYAYAGRFFAALVEAGVEHAVVSPGSRSTPLAIAAEQTHGLSTFIELDERAAAYFALGIGRATRRPAALVCTSGTAAVNYHPAVVEADHARVPLLVLTADRPSELRDFGAGQTIDQVGLYGRSARWQVEVPVPEAGEEALRHAGILAARAVAAAAGRPAGPVHLNWPLREPLAPTPTALAALRARAAAAATASPAAAARPLLRFSQAEDVADPRDVDELVALAANRERGVVCAGPMPFDERVAAALARFAAAAGWPLLADSASSLRAGPWTADSLVCDAGELLARSEGFAKRHAPEVVVRIGDPPVSKAQRLWLEGAAPAHVFWLDEGGQWGEPSRRATRVVVGGAASLLERAAERLGAAHPTLRPRAWARSFAAASARGRAAFDAAVRESAAAGGVGSGLAVARAVANAVPAGGALCVSNSMPIRLLDLAQSLRSAPALVACNRGASGIDGVTSTALGFAASAKRPTLLFTGDLALLHDLSGLLIAKRESIPLPIVVLDDGGGGIFSFLPIAEQGAAVDFDRLFRTPHGIDLARVAALFELDYAAPESLPALDRAIAEALARPRVSLIHARVDPERNVARFRAALAAASAAIDAEGSG